MPRITHEHIHEHLLAINRKLVAIGKDQDAMSRALQQMQQEQDANGHILRRTFRKVGKIMAAMDNLEEAVTRIEGVSDSVVALLTELSKEIGKLQNNTQAQALADRVTAKADALAAAVEANPDPDPTD